MRWKKQKRGRGMKLEKREITLNERDSIKDAYYMQKVLLNEYICSLEKVEKKQTRNELARLIMENIEALYLLRDLLKE